MDSLKKMMSVEVSAFNRKKTVTFSKRTYFPYETPINTRRYIILFETEFFHLNVIFSTPKTLEKKPTPTFQKIKSTEFVGEKWIVKKPGNESFCYWYSSEKNMLRLPLNTLFLFFAIKDNTFIDIKIPTKEQIHWYPLLNVKINNKLLDFGTLEERKHIEKKLGSIYAYISEKEKKKEKKAVSILINMKN